MVGFCWLTGWNFVRSSIDASFNSRMYSNLSITTTPEPLSGLVITMSSTTVLQPVFTSKKVADHLKVTEVKPPLINQQSVVYEFTCDLCDTNYIGYTCRHLHQRVEEHKHSVIGKHFRDVHDLTPDNLIKNFKVIKKCCGKLECLIYEMLWIKNKRPKLNRQANSIRVKLFT